MLENRTIRNVKNNNKTTPQMIEPQPQPELNTLNRVFKRVYEAIQNSFPEVKEVCYIYVFSEEEAERTGCDAQCNRFCDSTVSIGICITLFSDMQKLKYVLMHEIAHLRYWEHASKFYATVDSIVIIYNKRTGENISNHYEGVSNE